jgi:tungstate transport system substrate-binding protein
VLGKETDMRERNSLPGIRRAAAVVLAAVVVFAIAAPAVAGAAVRKPTISGLSYMSKSKTFTLSGSLGRGVAGRIVTIQVKKPGRAYWVDLTTRSANKLGRWSYKYKPILTGRYYFRARYTSRYSRNKSLRVRRGTGTKSEIILSSTTSTRDSGLFERLGPAFLHTCPEYTLKASFKGSGASIADGGMGNADVLLTHSPVAELKFMDGLVASGSSWVPSAYRGLTRHSVMYNDYVLLGPVANAAGVTLGESATSAFSKVGTGGGSSWVFVSRNDGSGTNTKEKEIWASIPIAISPAPAWYLASGTMGMAQAIQFCDANAPKGYTLADRATWLNVKNLGTVGAGTVASPYRMAVVNEGDPIYFNPYSVITVAGARNSEGAADFSAWIRSAEGQALIKSYGEYTYPGQVMFTPWAGAY